MELRRFDQRDRHVPGFVVVAIAVVALGLPADAQEPVAPTGPRAGAGQDGFVFESGSGDFRLQFGLLVHSDGRFAPSDQDELITDAFGVRRVRPYVRGRLGRQFEFFLNPDFAGGTLVVHDAYFDTIFSPALRVRIGKAKTPFGMERLHSASNLLFLERAFPTALAPNRDIGVQLLGDVKGGVVTYLAGVMNGVPDGGSADTDRNDGKDVSGRLVVRPFARLPASSPARGLGFGVSGSTGEQSGAGALPSFRTPTLQQPYFSFAGTSADGRRTRYSPQVFYFHRAFGGWAEYVHTSTAVTRGTTVVAENIEHRAWQVAVSWVLTGENATDAGAGIRPRAEFGSGSWGALQIAARYHAIALDAQAVSLGLASAGSSRKAEAWTGGLNWYLSRNVRNTVNVERTVFDDDADGPRPAENAVAFRTQVSF
jgi:phosphate-selective porin OprO/OprP